MCYPLQQSCWKFLQESADLGNAQSMSTLAELSCSASLHRFCYAFAVDQNDTVLNWCVICTNFNVVFFILEKNVRKFIFGYSNKCIVK